MRPDPRGPGLMVGEGVQIGEGSSFGPYTVLHSGAQIGAGVAVGSHVVVHQDAHIADRCVIGDHAIVGKRPKLAASSSAKGEVGALTLSPGVIVGAGAVVFAGASIGEGSILGDQSFVRERSTVGVSSVIGRGSVVDNDVQVGSRVSVQTNVYLTAYTIVEDDVFVGPGASTTNDDTMARHGPELALAGATLRRACRVGGSVVITPGIEVGEEAFIAAGAVLTRDVPAKAVVIGVPGRVVREVGSEDLLERWR